MFDLIAIFFPLGKKFHRCTLIAVRLPRVALAKNEVQGKPVKSVCIVMAITVYKTRAIF